jgi:hypothetical protein
MGNASQLAATRPTPGRTEGSPRPGWRGAAIDCRVTIGNRAAITLGGATDSADSDGARRRGIGACRTTVTAEAVGGGTPPDVPASLGTRDGGAPLTGAAEANGMPGVRPSLAPALATSAICGVRPPYLASVPRIVLTMEGNGLEVGRAGAIAGVTGGATRVSRPPASMLGGSSAGPAVKASR